MRKLILLAVLAMLVMGSALVSAQDLDSVDPTGQTITFWHSWDKAQLEALELLVAEFNETNEWGITVEHVSLGTTGDLTNAISAGIVSGELPNLTIAFTNDAMGWYLDGAVASLSPYINDATWGLSEEEAADLQMDVINVNLVDPANLPAGTIDEPQLLLWPVGSSANILSVNTDMLAELGFEAAPTTLEDFRAVACAAAELTGPEGEDVQGFPIRQDGFDLASWIAAQGGNFFIDGQYNFTNDAAITSLQFFQDLYNDGCAYIAEGFDNTAHFAYGLNPMAQGSTAGATYINNDIAASGVDKAWINTIVPYAENPTIQVFLRSMAVLEDTPEANLATWLFLKHLASADAQILWTEYTGYYPYSSAALEGISEEYLTNNPQYNTIREILVAEDTVIYAAPQILTLSQATSIMGELLAAVTTGGEDVATAAAAFEAEANEILADSMQ